MKIISPTVRLNETDDTASWPEADDRHAITNHRTGSSIWPRHDSQPGRVSLEPMHGGWERIEARQRVERQLSGARTVARRRPFSVLFGATTAIAVRRQTYR